MFQARDVALIPATSKMESFVAIGNVFKQLIIVTKLSILNVSKGPDCTSENIPG